MRGKRRWIRRALALCLSGTPAGVWAQAQPEPLPPPPQPTTVQEAPASPDGPQPPVAEPVEKPKVEEPKHVQETVSGIPLSTLETNNQSMR